MCAVNTEQCAHVCPSRGHRCCVEPGRGNLPIHRKVSTMSIKVLDRRFSMQKGPGLRSPVLRGSWQQKQGFGPRWARPLVFLRVMKGAALVPARDGVGVGQGQMGDSCDCTSLSMGDVLSMTPASVNCVYLVGGPAPGHLLPGGCWKLMLINPLGAVT